MEVCAVDRLFPRSSFTENVQNTAKSFKSWSTCMNDKPCKIIAIVGIALASIVALWIIGAILTCFRQGVTGIGGFFCWCCNCGRGSSRAAANEGFSRGAMATAPATVIYQPIQQPESAYYRNRDDSFYDERRKSNEVFELEQDFDLEKQREKSQMHRLPVVTSDTADEQSILPSTNTFSTNPWQSFNPMAKSNGRNSNGANYQNVSRTQPSPYPAEDVQSYQGYNYYHGR